jgi:hypothetical protein
MAKKRTTVLLAMLMTLALTAPATAREDIGDYPVKDALESDAAKGKVKESIRLFFGKQTHPEVAKSMGEFKTNKKTNAFNKSDSSACEWVFLAAVVALQERAMEEGGDAVINIKSNYKNNEFASEEMFQCGVGNVVAGVALKGEVVQLKE